MASSHSSATEQATGNATEHAPGLDAVAIDRADTSHDNLVVTLFRFLTYILQDPFSTPGFIDATEQTEDDCIDIIEESMTKSGCLLYTEQQLLVHKRVWDVVTRDKEGRDKEHFFADWCRRVASHSKNPSTAKKTSTATEHATEESEKSVFFRSLAEDLFANELTKEQKREHKYKLQKDKALMSPQRSWVNHMLRKNLGDARVGYYILKHGVPQVLNIPMRLNKVINKALLQNMLDEFMIWHTDLLQYIVTIKEHPAMVIAIRLSDLNQWKWREERRKLKAKAKHRLRDGKRLSEQKERGKRKWDDMSSPEKQLIEDYETNKCTRDYEVTLVKKPRI